MTEKASLSAPTQRAEWIEVNLRLLVFRITCPLSNCGQHRCPFCACAITAFHLCKAFTSPSFKQSLEIIAHLSSKRGIGLSPPPSSGEGCKYLLSTNYVPGTMASTAQTPVSFSPSSSALHQLTSKSIQMT
ncbi:hypothetical protein mRhiFer1_008496 [Rhinolophus ferrumequinum]|uniref:Uncharacterized protein n=1 Tax=Rhinolophus ferrumequinum TaxID=59479 RepID=A0A7J7UXF4_RHIFE|nr:hypothetical protein mRhiFer1_008496 [Rhinolophus ferrumequinum]